jgi:hypothetical protein
VIIIRAAIGFFDKTLFKVFYKLGIFRFAQKTNSDYFRSVQHENFLNTASASKCLVQGAKESQKRSQSFALKRQK